MQRLRALLDPFMLALIAMIALASLLPVRGAAVAGFEILTVAGIAALFFLHGARLSRTAIVAGLTHWRLHVLVLSCTFVMFPLLGLGMRPLAPLLLTPELYLGVLFLCALPSTVQSSIAFTAIAKGNVPAAVCSASLSNLLGVLMTPLLVSLLLATHGDATGSPQAVGRIALQLLAPFVAGHLSRPWIGAWVERRRRVLAVTDRGTVLLVVYVAFSASVVGGLWQRVPLPALAGALGVAIVLLALALVLTRWSSRRLGFDRADESAIVFCGSNKSLASGVPIAKILFAGNPALGMILLPVMLFHPIQLMACALLAQRYARRAAAENNQSI